MSGGSQHWLLRQLLSSPESGFRCIGFTSRIRPKNIFQMKCDKAAVALIVVFAAYLLETDNFHCSNLQFCSSNNFLVFLILSSRTMSGGVHLVGGGETKMDDPLHAFILLLQHIHYSTFLAGEFLNTVYIHGRSKCRFAPSNGGHHHHFKARGASKS